MIDPSTEAPYRLIVVGNASVGKTSILKQFIQGTFNAQEPPTSISGYCEHRIPVDGKQVALQIWDTAGQERFGGLSGLYFRRADAALFVFALTDPSSFKSLDFWFEKSQELEEDLLIYVVGNKSDLDSKIAVDRTEAEEWATDRDSSLFLTSALKNIGICELFRNVARGLLKRSLPPKAVRSELGANDPQPRRSCC
jgi:small GTP-binding protein